MVLFEALERRVNAGCSVLRGISRFLRICGGAVRWVEIAVRPRARSRGSAKVLRRSFWPLLSPAVMRVASLARVSWFSSQSRAYAVPEGRSVDCVRCVKARHIEPWNARRAIRTHGVRMAYMHVRAPVGRMATGDRSGTERTVVCHGVIAVRHRFGQQGRKRTLDAWPAPAAGDSWAGAAQRCPRACACTRA